MTSLFSRFGAIGSRLASTTCRRRPAEKRSWVCTECRAKGVQRSRTIVTTTGYGEDITDYDYSPPQASHRNVSPRSTSSDLRERSATSDDKLDLDSGLESAASSPPLAVDNTFESAGYIFRSLKAITRDPVDYRAELPIALRRKDSDRLLRAFIFAADDLTFIRELPAAAFTEILRLIDPAEYVEPFKEAHRDLGRGWVKLLREQPVEQVLKDFLEIVSHVVASRRAAGKLLSVVDYELLLKCASAVGDKRVAKAVWRDMHRDNVTPDVACWNHLLAAIVNHQHHIPEVRYKLRVTPHNLRRRSMPPGKAGHLYRYVDAKQWGYISYKVGNAGIKEEVTEVFNRMLKMGVLGTEETFALMISGMAREGDMRSARAVLKRVWNIDDANITIRKPSQLHRVKQFRQSSPLHPTERLLFTIAQAFGINNDIPTALRLVDYVASSYNIVIPTQVWQELFERTFVLAMCTANNRRKDRSKRHDLERSGRLPIQSLESLWNTLTAEPYNIRPTMDMYTRFIKNLADRQKPTAMRQQIEMGRRLYWESLQAAQYAKAKLLAAQRSFRRGQRSSDKVGALQRNFDACKLVERRNRLFIKRWMRLYLGQGGFKAGPVGDNWSMRDLPNLLNAMWNFAPRHISYETRTGRVDFEINTDSDDDEHVARRSNMRRLLTLYLGDSSINPFEPHVLPLKIFTGFE